MLPNKRYFILPLDISFMILSYIGAHWIRYEDWNFFYNEENFWTGLLLVVSSRTIVFLFSDIYRSVWAYASIHDLVEIIKTTLFSSLVSTSVLLFYNRFETHSRMVPILDTLLLLSFLCLRSLSWRMFRDYYLYIPPPEFSTKPTLLIGAGKTGVNLISELRSQKEFLLNPVGFLDEDPSKKGAQIQGIPVLGDLESLPEILQKFHIEEVIITTQNLTHKQKSFIIKTCEEFKLKPKIIPSFSEFISNPLPPIQQLREIRVEDLLGREAADLEIESIRAYLSNQTILVSGAGGSIGSEICRQVCQFNPKKLILLDSAETPLYEIDYEIRKKFPNVEILAYVADVKVLSRLSYIFELQKPSVVFHCAAYKHVPLMELNPSEAVLNNVYGTKNIADVSRLNGVEKFVLISTDKAVNPVNIMGVSKRVAELYIQHISPFSKTKFITVRFGNVLGSNGSVIPRFKEQIAQGGPVTVTHPDIIRYFMTIPEASQLVLQAGSMGNRGEIFLLDMGEPVKILELAEEVIRMSGFKPYKDIDIVFTGLRPGEKLYEELLLSAEGIIPTHHPKIMIAKATQLGNSLYFYDKLETLFELARENRNEEIFKVFKEIVPEYEMHEQYLKKENIQTKV